MACRRVLTVDDSLAMRVMLAQTLRKAGFDVVGTGDGSTALEMARREHFDLMLIDANLPSLDALQLIDSLRELPDHACTPLLMLTNEAANDRKPEVNANGATGWLAKPFHPEQLVAVVRRILN